MTAQETLVSKYYVAIFPTVCVAYDRQVVALYSPELYVIQEKEEDWHQQVIKLSDGLQYRWN